MEVAAAAQREAEEDRETNTTKLRNEKNRKEQEIDAKYGESKEEYKVDRSEEEEGVVIPSPDCPVWPALGVCRLFRFYWPGLWRAVAEEDVNKVREGEWQERGV